MRILPSPTCSPMSCPRSLLVDVTTYRSRRLHSTKFFFFLPFNPSTSGPGSFLDSTGHPRSRHVQLPKQPSRPVLEILSLVRSWFRQSIDGYLALSF
ncbi:hypothetical protein TWF106_011731 [Orbilia oligospora]|uniref:Uncharacterized protein n=1 Tax=Orbilia oligospora TaxID=2813651 RepID=A0A6G1LUF7_ORBOL|nr:hypothetical protein TWF788_011648 [Orbilia oligospora]KAF3196821.1 hypothetical protein TWF679_011482 [Orbilia oligospora]KAF3197434.1 hypothetical protein TWF191_011421 [Orbilia oligospora]KAF3213296.1 hypothetical protein TWF106_011731 [Orbilia oligospora]KAF3233959.1 hypothetical protein TWF192_011533 [Orbilia oligospora]